MLSAARRVLGALAVLALLAPAAEAQRRIVGGSPAPAGAYPFTAQVEADGQLVCGGTLIAARYVLTAAHCLADPAPDRVLLGTTRRGDPAAPRYGVTVATPASDLDVAVLRLDAPATVAQARLPRTEDAALSAVGVVGRALGWGRTNPLVPTLPTDLQQVDLPLRSDADCRAVFPDYDPDVTLCAGDPEQGRDTCNGDSGGPLLVPDGLGGAVLAGATSYGAVNCGEAYGAYAELSSARVSEFVRAVVPQVEVSPNGGQALTGDPITFTAAPRNPDGTGPFGGYDALIWDTDGDGFDDAPGATAVTVTARDGLTSVAVRATDAAGNAEVRRAGVIGRPPTLIGFATGTVRVREGKTARLTLLKTGTGTGSVVATPADGSAPVSRLLPGAGPATVGFDADAATSTIPYVLGDDRRVERDKSFVVTLGGATGDLRVGETDRAVVSVQDDDAAVRLPGPRRRAVRDGALKVPVDPNTTGRLEAVATLGGRTVAKARRRRIANARRRALPLKLTRVGVRRLARDRPRRVRVDVRLEPAGGGLPARAHRTLRVG